MLFRFRIPSHHASQIIRQTNRKKLGYDAILHRNVKVCNYTAHPRGMTRMARSWLELTLKLGVSLHDLLRVVENLVNLLP